MLNRYGSFECKALPGRNLLFPYRKGLVERLDVLQTDGADGQSKSDKGSSCHSHASTTHLLMQLLVILGQAWCSVGQALSQ